MEEFSSGTSDYSRHGIGRHDTCKRKGKGEIGLENRNKATKANKTNKTNKTSKTIKEATTEQVTRPIKHTKKTYTHRKI